MARLGVLLKGRDVRCLSSTFIVVVFFTCIFLLSLHPSQYPTKISMVNLPKDEVVRAQSIPALDPFAGKTTTVKGPVKDGKKTGKADQKNSKNERKANKAKWIKDELPKKAHGGNSSAHDMKNAVKDVIKDTNAKKHEEALTKQADTEARNKQVQTGNNTSIPLNTSRPEPPQTNNRAKSDDTKLSTRAKTPFSNLSSLQLESFASPYIETKVKPGSQKTEKKIITWYKPENVREINRKRKAMENCPESACKVMYPLPEGVVADAIIFDGVDKQGPPPARVHPDQVYVFHEMKSPSFPQQGVWPGSWNSVFNWTWTYRRDSDIWQPLGLLKKAHKVRSLEYFYELTKGKTRAVAFIPHTCPLDDSSSKRNEFVQEMGKYVRIAEFGHCSNKTCARGGDSCSQVLSKRFFFLLAVEDDICKDHVTEVFYRAWHDGTYVVPIVRGGADYAAYFPEGTFIDADWFDDAKQLSEFLVELIASRNLYSQLLWRKAHWIRAAKRGEQLGLCQLCYKLHHLEANRKRYTDIHRWFEKGVCKNP